MFLYFLISCIYVYINVINIIKINFGGHYEKILGLLALMVAVSGIASADQDVLKDIKFSTEVRQSWQDRKGQKANGIGMPDSKKITEQEQDGEILCLENFHLLMNGVLELHLK